MMKILICSLMVFGTALTDRYTSNRASEQQPPDFADSSFRWRLRPDNLANGAVQNNGKQGALDVKGLYKRVLLDLGQDRVLLETENGCAQCDSLIDQRISPIGNNEHLFVNRAQDLQSRYSTNLDDTSRTISSNEAGLRPVPFPQYSFNVGEVRVVKLKNGDKIRVTANKPNYHQSPSKPFLPVPQHFPSRSGQLPSFSPKISGAPTKQGLIQIGPKMYVRVTANKTPPPPPPPAALQSRFQQTRTQQSGIQSLYPLPPVTRPPLTQGVYDFYATTEQPCGVQENELPLSPGSASGYRTAELLETNVDIRGNLPVSPFAANSASRSTSTISEKTDLISRSQGLQETSRGETGLPVSPFPVNSPQLPVSPFATNSKTTSRISETSDRSGGLQQGERTGLPVSPFPQENSKPRSQQGTGLPVSPFPQDNSAKQNVADSKTIEISPGKYIRVTANKDQPKAPSRDYIPPYGSLAPPTRPPLTQGVADQYSQNLGTQGSGARNEGAGPASDPNKKLIEISPGKYIRVTANKDQQKS